MLAGDAADLLGQTCVQVLLNDRVIAVICVHFVDQVAIGRLLEYIFAALCVNWLDAVSLTLRPVGWDLWKQLAGCCSIFRRCKGIRSHHVCLLRAWLRDGSIEFLLCRHLAFNAGNRGVLSAGSTCYLLLFCGLNALHSAHLLQPFCLTLRLISQRKWWLIWLPFKVNHFETVFVACLLSRCVVLKLSHCWIASCLYDQELILHRQWVPTGSALVPRLSPLESISPELFFQNLLVNFSKTDIKSE